LNKTRQTLGFQKDNELRRRRMRAVWKAIYTPLKYPHPW